MADDREVMAVWGVRILYALAGFLVYFVFTMIFTTGESTKATMYRIDSDVNILKNDRDSLKAKDIELLARIVELEKSQGAGLPRMREIEINTQNLGSRINERTEELGRKIDNLVGQVQAIDNFLRTGTPAHPTARQTR